MMKDMDEQTDEIMSGQVARWVNVIKTTLKDAKAQNPRDYALDWSTDDTSYMDNLPFRFIKNKEIYDFITELQALAEFIAFRSISDVYKR